MKRPDHRQLVVGFSFIFLTVGVVISIYAGYQIRMTNIEINRPYIQAAELSWQKEVNTGSSSGKLIPAGTFLGTIHFPTIEKTFNIFEGTDTGTLSKGVGHYLKSVMPGEPNNSVLAGHRNSVFAQLGQIKIGALIDIRVRDGAFTYKVNKIKIVDKNDRTVIVPTKSAVLTLSTCYPFSYFGSAPKRYIVTADLVEPINRK